MSYFLETDVNIIFPATPSFFQEFLPSDLYSEICYT
jgi:hypothetical protein